MDYIPGVAGSHSGVRGWFIWANSKSQQDRDTSNFSNNLQLSSCTPSVYAEACFTEISLALYCISRRIIRSNKNKNEHEYDDPPHEPSGRIKPCRPLVASVKVEENRKSIVSVHNSLGNHLSTRLQALCRWLASIRIPIEYTY